MTTGLIIVDVQNDFCEGGSLAVEGGGRVAAGVRRLLRTEGGRYAVVVATRDWHIDPGEHFSDHPDYVDSWPVHCVADSPGAEFHPDVAAQLEAVDAVVAVVVSKGGHAAAYSGFEGFAQDGRPLIDVLKEVGVDWIDVVGLATDYCVRATALDAKRAGFGVRVLIDLCAGVAPATTRSSLEELEAAGVELG